MPGNKSCLQLRRQGSHSSGEEVYHKGLTPDLSSEISTNTERDICVPAQSGLNDEPTILSLGEAKHYPSFVTGCDSALSFAAVNVRLHC